LNDRGGGLQGPRREGKQLMPLLARLGKMPGKSNGPIGKKERRPGNRRGGAKRRADSSYRMKIGVLLKVNERGGGKRRKTTTLVRKLR